MEKKYRNVIPRLSRYRNSIYRFKALGFAKINSETLAEAVDVTASQVRKDFSIFEITGNKRGGYHIDLLLERLNGLLGKNETQNVVLIGAGNLGAALMKYRNFELENIKITAVFDIDKAKWNPRAAVPILPLHDLEKYVRARKILIGILCVPDIAAQEAFSHMVKAGIRGVLNFAPIQLKTSGRCIVNNVNLEFELENLAYFVKDMDNGK